MRLWTMQSLEVLDRIFNEGRYVCDGTRSELLQDECFVEAYEWMSERMHEKVGTAPVGVKYPVWAWHTRDGKHKKPDLRQRYAARGVELVCIELEIPDEDVLLSDFDKWHYVLYRAYVYNTSSDGEYEAVSQWYDSLPEESQLEEMHKSWENIFDVEHGTGGANGLFIQATFWELKCEYVKRWWVFMSK